MVKVQRTCLPSGKFFGKTLLILKHKPHGISLLFIQHYPNPAYTKGFTKKETFPLYFRFPGTIFEYNWHPQVENHILVIH
jgi:hypothetical protein